MENFILFFNQFFNSIVMVAAFVLFGAIGVTLGYFASKKKKSKKETVEE